MSLAAAAAAALAALAAGGAGATGTDGATVRFAVKGDWGTGSPAQAAVTRRMCGEWRREPFACFLRREMTAPPGPVRIVAFHQPLRTAGIRPPDPEQRRLWEPLLRRGRVALVLQGHNHLYERLEVGGITYITTSGGGDRLYPCLRPAEGLRSCRLAHHFLAVRVSARGIDVRAVTPRGVTLERVRIPTAPSRP